MLKDVDDLALNIPSARVSPWFMLVRTMSKNNGPRETDVRCGRCDFNDTRTPCAPIMRKDSGARKREIRSSPSSEEKKGLVVVYSNRTTLLCTCCFVRYKLDFAHMANTYLCRRRNSHRSKNANFQQTHWPDKKAEELHRSFMEFLCPRLKANDLISRKRDKVTLSLVKKFVFNVFPASL